MVVVCQCCTFFHSYSCTSFQSKCTRSIAPRKLSWATSITKSLFRNSRPLWLLSSTSHWTKYAFVIIQEYLLSDLDSVNCCRNFSLFLFGMVWFWSIWRGGHMQDQLISILSKWNFLVYFVPWYHLLSSERAYNVWFCSRKDKVGWIVLTRCWGPFSSSAVRLLLLLAVISLPLCYCVLHCVTLCVTVCYCVLLQSSGVISLAAAAAS